VIWLLLAAVPVAALGPEARFQPVAGYLVQAGPKGVFIDCGRRKDVAVGDLFAVVRPGPPMIHPVTRRPMAGQEQLIAVLKVIRVEADYSICRPLSRYLRVPLARGLQVRRFAVMPAIFIDMNGTGVELFSRLRELLPQLDWADYNLGLRCRGALRQPGGLRALGYDLCVVSQGSQVTLYDADQEVVGAWPAADLQAASRGERSVAGRGRGAAKGKYDLSTEDAEKALLNHYRLVAKVNLVVKGMDFGDLDGNGRVDIIFTDGEKIYVYEMLPKGLKYRYRYHYDKWGTIINVAVGDIDGDRRDEILINTFKETEDGFSSFVIGRRKGKFRVLVEHVPYTMGLLGGKSVAERGCYLVGQGFTPEELFNRKVYRLKYSRGKIMAQGEFAVPDGFTLPGALYADINHDRKRELCFINPRNFLEVYQGGQRLWMSGERLGGSLMNVQYEVGTAKISYTDKRQINPPMRFYDLNGDGHRSLVLSDNESGMSTAIGDYGFLIHGRIKMVRASGTGFSVTPVTGRLGGPVQGLARVGNELLVAMVKRSDDLLKTSGTTYLLAFPLPERAHR
jgi:hypothetical protein